MKIKCVLLLCNIAERSIIFRMNRIVTISYFLLIVAVVRPASSILCYQCVSTHPGCGSPFQWIWYKSTYCPEDDDVCVKVIERKDSEEIITRDCLSSIKGFRTDIPADHYEGCRASTYDPKLANYVNNSIKEIDIKRDYYDSVTFCFCYFDHWCNAGSHIQNSNFFLAIVVMVFLWRTFHS